MVKIVFQNEDYIVIEKPAGLAVHPGINTNERTLVDFLLEKFPEIKSVGDAPELRPGIVHRLDKGTSGVMVVARNQKTFEYLKGLFKNRKIEKKYIALVHGKLKDKEGKIEGEMGRSKKDFRKQSLVRGKVKVRKERYSLTFYKVIGESDKFSVVEVYPKTGRMHQIRVHMHSIGHPIVGDEKYTFKEFLPRRQAGKKENYPRMFLHAAEITFQSQNGKPEKFKSALPREFETSLEK
ncbi:MAG: RNA pseudouridine synthase [Parcubacteria group bacterium]|jgi:23S rRNA pseudouridine1911/1915/1917 synthase